MCSQGFPFEVLPSTFEENLDKSSFSVPWEYAVETSRGKAREVANRLKVGGEHHLGVFWCTCIGVFVHTRMMLAGQ